MVSLKGGILNKSIIVFISLLVVAVFTHAKPPLVPAFPGAEGFGAKTTGGRGGIVVYVTNLNATGPGSLNAALSMTAPRYILFKVSGVVSSGTNYEGLTQVKKGNFTLAGQTSPGGILTRGLFFRYNSLNQFDTAYNTGNVIIRHIRSVNAEDALRVIATRNVIVDHCSFAWAEDETAQVSYVTNLTIQNCILGENINANHTRYGGMLVSYGNSTYPLDSLSIHHNLWMRLGGRLPQCDCYDDSAWCQGRNFKFEFSNNLYWDPGAYMEFKSVTLNNDLFLSYNLNSVNNYYKVRSSYNQGLSSDGMTANVLSKIFLSGNKVSKFPMHSDYQLVNCCYGFVPPTNLIGPATRLTTRHPHPLITYTPTDSLRQYMIKNCGKFPRDSIDIRYMNWLIHDAVDTTVSLANGESYMDAELFKWKTAPLPPTDSDSDGMPDTWEDWNGLHKNIADHNGFELSGLYYPGYDSCYTNLEVYLNMLSDSLVAGSSSSTVKGKNHGTKAKMPLNSNVNKFMNETKIEMYSINGKKIKEFTTLSEALRFNKIAKTAAIIMIDRREWRKVFNLSD